MSADDHSDTEEGADPDELGRDVRDRLEEGADSAIEQFDEGLVDLLSWLLDTETRARIYVHLRQHPESTSEEIAEGTGLYPSTVREALAELHEESWVNRSKRENDGAGNNPYEYSALPPSELVGSTVDEIQTQLNAAFNLDQYLSDDDDADSGPVTITVTDEADASADLGDSEESESSEESENSEDSDGHSADGSA